jgi:hypothetical protein
MSPIQARSASRHRHVTRHYRYHGCAPAPGVTSGVLENFIEWRTQTFFANGNPDGEPFEKVLSGLAEVVGVGAARPAPFLARAR